MEATFISAINILKVRHLKDIVIPLSSDKRKHLVITGKNGSGKTSLMKALLAHFCYIVSDDFHTKEECVSLIQSAKNELALVENAEDRDRNIRQCEYNENKLKEYQTQILNWEIGATADFQSYSSLRRKYLEGEFIFAYYPDNRCLMVEEPETIEKIRLRPVYNIQDGPSKLLEKYMVDLKASQAFSHDKAKIKKIDMWFDQFQAIMRKVYEDDTLTLEFNEETYRFSICVDGKEPFDFNSMSMGYSAIFSVISDLIMRMETKGKYNFELEGVVLIDEVESHLHVTLQKQILPILIEMFPNLQFIVSTHSPFILSSISNSAVYDLENHVFVENGLTSLPYEGITEGWFGADRLSEELRQKYDRYRELASKDNLTDDDFAEASRLEIYLDNIPSYLAWDITTEYRRLKLELSNKA